MNSKSAVTIEDFAAQGMSQGQGQQFAQDLQHIHALKIFLQVFPAWCRQHNASVDIHITGHPQWDGAGVQFAFDRPTLPVAAANDLIERLSDASRLMELEAIVERIRGLGVATEVVNALVDEANALAEKIAASVAQN